MEFPPLLQWGDEEAFDAYRAEFDRLYHSGPVFDVLDRRVIFERAPDRPERDACCHVCFKDQRDDRYRRLPRVWDPARAERIPWIRTALVHPYEIRPSHQTEHHQVYLVSGTTATTSGDAWERFGVYVDPIRDKQVRFVTAFPIEKWYWDDARLRGPRIYPEPKRRRR